ncbi:MAG TPA: ABC transporter permease [Chitinophagaceae bacterium]|jgi:ABC-2 type transport system permease protein|nr:ABC transporter permease [Chitinophagaceae bacterium]
MTFLSALQLYYVRKIKEALRNRAYVGMTLGIPLMYLVFFAPLLKNLVGGFGFPSGNVLDMFMPGLLCILAVFGGLFVGFGLVDEIRSGIIERFRVTPTSRLAILLGPVLRDVTALLIQAVIMTLIMIPFGLQVHWGGFVVLLVLMGMTTALFASFSYTLALKLRSEDAIAPILQGISLPILLLAGFLLPMSLAPGWLQVVAHIDPVYYAVEAGRALINGDFHAAAIWQAFAVITPLMMIVFLWAARSYRKVVA